MAKSKAPKSKRTKSKKSSAKKVARKAKTRSKKKTATKKSAGGRKATRRGPAKKTTKAKKTAKKKAPVKKKSVKKKSAKKKSAKKKSVKKKSAKKKSVKKKSVKKKSVKKVKTSKKKTAASSRRAATPPRKQVPKAKVLPRQFLLELAEAIKEAVAPVALALKGREIVSTAISGDATFELDKIAEKALLNHLRSVKAPVAYYSEDAGYSTFSSVQPKYLIIVDPIDGTRAAKSAFEGSVIAIATTRILERPTMADVDNALVLELFNDRYFFAERGKGAKIYSDGHSKKPKLTSGDNLESLTWSMTVPARPAELIFPTSARLIDLSSLKGGFFACNSTSYSLTRLLTNQLDACVDFAGRYMRDIPELVRDFFINAGRGVVIGIAPYDLAASLLIAEEAGCIVTDAYGNGFEDVLLLDSTEANQLSLIAASNPDLHKKLMIFFDTRIKQLEALYKRRAQARF